MSISKIKIVRALWTNPWAPSDWSKKYLYPEIPMNPTFPNEIVYVWGDDNVKILKERGKSVDDTLLNTLKKERLEDLARPEENQEAWIIIGYVFAFIGGLLAPACPVSQFRAATGRALSRTSTFTSARW